MSFALPSHRLALVLIVILACCGLACPNARTAPGPGSYGNESSGEAMEEEEAERDWEESDR